MATRTVSKRQWESLEHWGATAFLLGGGLFALVIVSLVALGDAAPVLGVELALVVVFLLVAIGMGGLHPRLQRHAGRVADVGVTGAALAGFGALLALVIIALAASTGWSPGLVELVVWMGTLTAFAIGFLAFGVAVLRTDVITRTVGGLLLAGGVFLLVYVTNTILWGLDGLALGMMVLWGIVLLGTGALLRGDAASAA